MRHAQFRRDRLANDHRAGIAQSAHHDAVALREIAGECAAAHLRWHIRGFDQILDADWHAINGGNCAARLVARGRSIGASAGAGFIQHNEGAHHAILRRNGLKAAFQIGAGVVLPGQETRHGIVKTQALEAGAVIAAG